MAREKVKHEAPLIEFFHSIIEQDEIFGIDTKFNFGSDTNAFSDVEYLAKNGELIILEAKSHESKGAYNTRQKIFGQLLKEHGKKNQYRKKHSENLGLWHTYSRRRTKFGEIKYKEEGN